MSEHKQTGWIISSTESMVSKVVFSSPVTEAQAKAHYRAGLYEDVLDQNMSHVVSVQKAEPWGDGDDD